MEFRITLKRFKDSKVQRIINMKINQIFDLFLGLEPEDGFRRKLSCDPENATFSSIPNINDSYLFPYLEDDDKFDYCKPFKYTGSDDTKPCSIDNFDRNNRSIVMSFSAHLSKHTGPPFFQLISKGNFSVFNMNLEMLIFALAYWGRNFSFVFWEKKK